MQQGRQGVRWWVLGSAALMVVGGFGPWVKTLGQSVGGTDGANDGWLVVAAAVIGGLLYYVLRERRAGGVWALLAGVAGVAITLYDRSNVQNAIDTGGAFAQALVQVGWGLNLALGASLSFALSGLVALARPSQTEPVVEPLPRTPLRTLPSSPTPPPEPLPPPPSALYEPVLAPQPPSAPPEPVSVSEPRPPQPEGDPTPLLPILSASRGAPPPPSTTRAVPVQLDAAAGPPQRSPGSGAALTAPLLSSETGMSER